MWNIKDVKKNGKKLLKNNIWTLIFLTLFTSIFIGEYMINNDGFSNLKTVYYYVIERDKTSQDKGIFYFINEYTDKIITQTLTGNKNDNVFGRVTQSVNEYNEKNNIYKGVFYGAFNVITKGHSQVQNAMNSVFNYPNNNANKNIVLIITALIGLLIRIFLHYPIMVGETRIYLESKNYPKTKIKRITFAFKKKRYLNCVKTILLMNIRQFLWNFTIIGGIIKKYSYKMVTYIIAENPNIKAKDAIKISEEMMRGNKFKAFKLDLSFIGWYILQYATFGLLGIVISPYYTATYTELYSCLRKEYKDTQKYQFELLNDESLFEENELEVYPDILELENEKKKKKIDYDKKYELTSIILFFFIFAFIGWAWEVLLYLVDDGILVNRGALYGPWLPIYGFGCSIIVLLTVFEKFRKMLKNPTLTFVVITILCTILEYATSFVLEKTMGILYWDYTGIFLNINGRVCFENSLFFGLGGCVCIYIVAPFIEKYLQKIKKGIKIPLCVVLISLILIDFTYSLKHPHIGEGISQEAQR